MSTLRDQVLQLYTPIYDEFMLESFAEEKQVHPMIYDVIDDKTSEYKVDGLSGLGLWEDAGEGEGGQYDDPVLGYPKTFTQAKRRKRFRVSFEAVDHDEYALMSKVGTAQEMGRGARGKVEKGLANFLSDGFATAGPDGQYLFDTDHPKNPDETGITFSNLLSGAFSHDNLELAETQITNNYIGPDGLPIMPDEDPILLYPPALRGAVKRVLADRAEERPGTANRDINRFAGRYQPIEWRWLAATFGGSDTAWYIIYPSMKMLKLVWSARPHYNSWIDYEDEFYVFSGRMLYDFGASNWRFGFGSTGL